jgi:hypothetical protein
VEAAARYDLDSLIQQLAKTMSRSRKAFKRTRFGWQSRKILSYHGECEKQSA